MKLSEKYLEKNIKWRKMFEHLNSVETLSILQIKRYGEYCRLEGMQEVVTVAHEFMSIEKTLQQMAKEDNP